MAAFSFPTFPAGMKLVDTTTGAVTALFQRWWNVDLKNRLEEQEALQDEILTTLTAQQATLTAAVERLERAVVSTSWTVGNPPTVTAGATNATVSIPAHTRHYGDVAKAVNAGTISAIPFGATRYIYYDDETRAGGAVTYVATDNPAAAQTSATNPRRHFVGQIIAPASSTAPATTGETSRPPTYSGDNQLTVEP